MKKSIGHIGFSADGAVEFYAQGGEVYHAPIANAFDVDGRRHGRWEGSLSWWERHGSRLLAAA